MSEKSLLGTSKGLVIVQNRHATFMERPYIIMNLYIKNFPFFPFKDENNGFYLYLKDRQQPSAPDLPKSAYLSHQSTDSEF